MQDFGAYKKDLIRSLARVADRPMKMFYTPAFEFANKKGPLVLIGDLQTGLQKDLKGAKIALKPGKCRRNGRDEIEVLRGLGPEKIERAFKFAGIPEKIGVEEFEEEEPTHSDAKSAEPVSPLPQRVVPDARKDVTDKTTEADINADWKRLEPRIKEAVASSKSRKKEIVGLLTKFQDAVKKKDWAGSKQFLVKLKELRDDIFRHEERANGIKGVDVETIQSLKRFKASGQGKTLQEVQKKIAGMSEEQLDDYLVKKLGWKKKIKMVEVDPTGKIAKEQWKPYPLVTYMDSRGVGFRCKPKGEPNSQFPHMQPPHGCFFAVKNPEEEPEWTNEAFKIFDGEPIPSRPDQLIIPDGLSDAAAEEFRKKHWTAKAHIAID